MNKKRQPKIILLNPVTRHSYSVLRVERCQQRVLRTVGLWPPVSLLEVATVLEEKGFLNVEILDAEIEALSFNEMIEILVSEEPDYVVIPITLPTLEDDKILASQLRKSLSRLTVIATGIHASVCPQEVSSSDGFQYCVHGEPYKVVSDLIAALEDITPLNELSQGISYLGKDGRCLRNVHLFSVDVPYPRVLNRDYIRSSKYVLPYFRQPFTIIKTSYGCDYNCSFCTSHAYYGPGWQGRSVSAIIDELVECVSKYNIHHFLFLSDTFNARREQILELCSAIIDRRLNIQWVSNCRIDLVDEELVLAMKEAGCALLSLGIESYDADVQRINRKNLDLQKVQENIGIIASVGIHTYGYFMFGLHGDTLRKALCTIWKASRSRLDFVRFYTVTPYTGTDYYEKYRSSDTSQYFHGLSTTVTHGAFTPFTLKLLKVVGYVLFYSSLRRFKTMIKQIVGACI